MVSYAPAAALGATLEISEIESLAKGTGIFGDGTGAPSSVPVGADNTILQADSAQSAGVGYTADPILDTVTQQGANVQKTVIKQATTELTGLTRATVTATDLIPAGSFLIGVTARVTTTITGATTFDIGDGTDVDRWGAAIALPAGTTSDITDFTASGFGQFGSANNVVLTANVANFTAGAVRLTAHYISLTAPTS